MLDVRYARAAALLSVVILTGSCGATVRQGPAAAPAGARAQPTEVRRTHENLNATVWMQTSVEYRASALQAYHAARVALDAALADPGETAALEQTNDPSALPPAIVLDLDETVLDNSPFEARMIADSTAEKAVGYDEAAWRRWVSERKATAIPGAVEFLKYARSRGVTPVYVTNRDVKDADGHDTGEAATRDVLKKLGIPAEERTDTVLMRGENGWDWSDKGARRAFVSKSYRILLLVGDNFEDFLSVPANEKSIAGRDALASRYADRWGTRWIVLPNPTYGSWEQAITLGLPPGDDVGALRRKYAALKLDR